MPSPFDSLLDAANSTLRGVFGDSASWTPSTGGSTQTGTVLFRRPVDPASLEFRDYIDASPSFEYHAGTFAALRAAVIAGNTEQVTVDGTAYTVQSVAVVEDGRAYRAILSEAAPMVAREIPGSDLVVKLIADTVPAYDTATEDRPEPVRSTIVDFGRACTVRNLSVQLKATPTGVVEAGDFEVLIPAALVTEAQLRTDGALLLYGDADLSIDRIDPHSVVLGTVVQWRVIGSRLAGPNG
jgi:hypothetical protein